MQLFNSNRPYQTSCICPYQHGKNMKKSARQRPETIFAWTWSWTAQQEPLQGLSALASLQGADGTGYVHCHQNPPINSRV